MIKVCKCGKPAEMMTSINYCWVQCTHCPATGSCATDYDTATIYWDNGQYQYPPSPPPSTSGTNEPPRDGVGG